MMIRIMLLAMKNIFKISAFLAFLALTPSVLPGAANADDGLEIATLVNGTPISKFDIDQQTKLLLVTANIQPSPENIRRARARSLEQLIENVLRREEARRHSIFVSPQEIEQAISRIIGSGQTPDEFLAFLKENGIYRTGFYNHIHADLLWRKVVQRRIVPRIVLNQSQVSSRLTQAAESLKQTNFLMSWIVLPFENKPTENQARELAKQLRQQVSEGASFDSLARNFSRGPNASQGGDLGWLPENELPPPLLSAARRMTVGNISAPIRLADGFYLIYLRDRRGAGDAPAEKKRLHLFSLSVPIPPGTSARALQQRVKKRFPNCERAPEFAKTIGGSGNDMGFVPASDLSEDVRRKLRKAKVDEIIPSLTQGDVQEFLALCGRKVESLQATSRRGIENRMLSEEANMRARQLLRDLRRDANIEERDITEAQNKEKQTNAKPN